MLKRLLSILIAGLFLASSHAAEEGVKIGIQTWTLRNLNFEQSIQFAAKHGIKYLQLIPNHINPNGSREEWQQKKTQMEQLGLIPYTFGVAATSMQKEENRKLFEFAKFMGMKLIIVEPGDYRILDNLEELAKEYDIKVAIHNHGIKSPYGNPLVVRNLIMHRDSRMGVCMDTGWITSARFDAAKTFQEYQGRVFDIHLKDKKVAHTPTGDVATDTFIGEGDTKFDELFKVLKESKYNGVLAIETDNNLKDPTEHVSKALSFTREKLLK
ncbi:MAG: sugar phosphate isomerase/epimerase [Verrucomicrobiota bacterium]|nr:sugar phosphate isomerase/epimerase [Verrucomicrobiota bacterium]